MPAAGTKRPRILLPTIRPGGGVGTMQLAVAACLEKAGASVTLAYHQPYRSSPELSVPLWRLGQRKPKSRAIVDRYGRTCIEIGAWLPEIESLRYRASRLWRETLRDFDGYVAVCGTVFAAQPMIDLGCPAVIWISTPYDTDRRARARNFPLMRRLFDRLIDAPLCRRTERRLLPKAPMFTNSSYTKRELTRMAPGGDFRVMPIPVDSDFFTPGERALPMSGKPTRIGLVGRLDDARKNPQLLLEAAAVLVQAGHDLNLIFVGGAANEALSTKARALGLTSRIAFKADLSMEELRDAYRSFDVLAITSDQEGLGLVGLEAMACGAAVVSTRCGGPEDYILDGTTGLLVDFDKKSLADAVERLILEPRLAQDLARAGQALVRQRYSIAAFTQTLLAALQSTHGLDLHTRDGV